MRFPGRLLLGVVGLSVSLSVGAQTRVPPKPARPATYGTSVVSYLRIPAAEFLPAASGTTYGPDFTERSSAQCSGECFTAALHLPGGAQVVYLELDFNDTSASNFVLGGLEECDYLGALCTGHPAAGAGPADCFSTGLICSGAANADGRGYVAVDVSGDSIFVNNNDNEYVLVAGNQEFSTTSRLTGMLVGYVLVVSPPPATADFTDVPANHPFFQYIEALYHSGITAGCGGGNFCPNSPLTRGQMAVFLAKALGLQWQ